MTVSDVAEVERPPSTPRTASPAGRYERVQTYLPDTDLAVAARYMLQLMLRNVATDGFTFVDPASPPGAPRRSRPGCVLASPSYPANLSRVDQDYVYHWTRDAAITAIELAHQPVALSPEGVSQTLCDYVTFTRACQQDAIAAGHPYRACFQIDATIRLWSDQADGPALENLAFVAAWPRLDPATREVAREVAQQNLDRLVDDLFTHNGSGVDGMFNLWEEVTGPSFFARAVQLRCLEEARSTNTLQLALPAGLPNVVSELGAALAGHWDAGAGLYRSVPGGSLPAGSLLTDLDGYDPNIDVVLAALYGAVDVTDPRLLATAARIRWQWADPASPDAYPVNAADAARDMGPLFGRYPGDVYDGDTDARVGDHPWALCTAAFAQLCYEVATAVKASGQVPQDALAAPFFEQVGVTAGTSAPDAVQSLVDAGDSMLRATVFHSDHLELSEQFDGITGYEKSVRNLTWSYAAYLSAVRSRKQALGA